MSTSQMPLKEHENITPPSSFAGAPLTPPPTDEKAFTQASRVVALFKDIQAGRHIERGPWTSFQLAGGEYEEIERQIRRDESLFGYVEDKIRCVASGRIETPADDGNWIDMTMTEGRINLLSACLQLYMNCSSLVLRMPFIAS